MAGRSLPGSSTAIEIERADSRRREAAYYAGRAAAIQDPKGEGRRASLLRGNPLREEVPQISFAVTIVGKMHTADLKGEPLPCDAGGGWRNCERARLPPGT
jgi:hypothetical protein